MSKSLKQEVKDNYPLIVAQVLLIIGFYLLAS